LNRKGAKAENQVLIQEAGEEEDREEINSLSSFPSNLLNKLFCCSQ
jgi:hypothetical protein